MSEEKPDGDAKIELLPPWRKYPEIPRFSIGWRMGYGETYMLIWGEWATCMDQGQLIEYFRKYVPLPVEWVGWVSSWFRHEGLKDYMNAETVLWLEQQGLVNFAEYKAWYEELLRRANS